MKVGIITFTDGRKRAAEKLEEQCFEFQRRVAEWLFREGHEAVENKSIVWNHRTAVDAAQFVNEKQCAAVVFNFCVWAFPDFAAQCARDVESPILFLGNVNPAFPGWVAFFAAAGALEEFGRPFGRALGELNEKSTADTVRAWLKDNEPDKRKRGYDAAADLHGLRYGEFDGPSMGMYTGHIDPSQWMQQFGVHVFHRSQLTLAWLCDEISDERVEQGLAWLERHCGGIEWNADRLSKGVNGHLGKQVRFYLACKDYCKAEGLDFLGLTGQLDYTEWKNGMTMDVPEALLNDTADWEDENKRPTICATECDSNGALTMQLLHNLSGTPVLFADLRHYFTREDVRAAGGECKWDGVYDLVNSGQHAPWFSKRSKDFRDNWKQVTLHPSDAMYFPNGGASVEFFADAADKVTFARITRKSGQYRMHFFAGGFTRFGDDVDQKLAAQTSPTWPHCFAVFDCSKSDLAQLYSSNHIHAVFGDWLGELEAACEALGIEAIRMS